jgi:hypothetical protein
MLENTWRGIEYHLDILHVEVVSILQYWFYR